MEPIFNNKTAKSLFKAPRGQKFTPPPPPPPINSTFRSFVFFFSLLVGLTIEVVAQNARISLSLNGASSQGESNRFLGSAVLNISQQQTSATKESCV